MRIYRLVVKAKSPRSARRYTVMRCPGARDVTAWLLRADEFIVEMRCTFNEQYALARWEHENIHTAQSTGLPFGALLLWHQREAVTP